MEVVVVTAWRRAEFLRAALNRLLVADDPELQYLLALDRRFTPQARNVALWFQRKLGAERVKISTRAHVYSGNSYNVLTSYAEALRMRPEPELVHLVEEDVLIASDYFDFHRRAHKLAPGAFVVSACRNQQFPLGTEPPSDDLGIYLHPSYQSLGVSFRPEPLRRVLRHSKPAYWSNPVAYCKKQFPETRIPPANAEQDGLIHRIIEAEGGATVYPAVARAYHVGFSGYHRKGKPLSGTIEERANQIVSMSTDELNRHAFSYPDHQAVPLDAERAPVSKLIEWGS